MPTTLAEAPKAKTRKPACACHHAPKIDPDLNAADVAEFGPFHAERIGNDPKRRIQMRRYKLLLKAGCQSAANHELHAIIELAKELSRRTWGFLDSHSDCDCIYCRWIESSHSGNVKGHIMDDLRTMMNVVDCFSDIVGNNTIKPG